MQKSHKLVYSLYALVWIIMAINPKYPNDWLLENVLVFNSRTEYNFLHKVGYKSSTMLIVLVIFTQLLHIACMHIPFMQNVLSTQPVSFETWIQLAVIAIGLVIVMEIDKWFMLKKRSL